MIKTCMLVDFEHFVLIPLFNVLAKPFTNQWNIYLFARKF